MTSPQLPPDGFRWVESESGEQPPSTTVPRRRWWWIALAIAAVLALTAGLVVMVWRPWSNGRGGASGPPGTPPHEWPTGTPKELLVPFPLNPQPVQGWRVTVGDIGLPPRTYAGNLFASIGDKAYFVTSRCNDDACSQPMGWVYGLDTRTGNRLFAPVPMTGFYGGADDCYSNGPTEAVCVTEGFHTERPQLIWLIDLNRGVVSFTGQTQLYPRHHGGPEPKIRPIGNYLGETRLVAFVEDKGIYGIGSHAELTWFLPGRDAVTPNYLTVSDIPPMALARQQRLSSDQSGPRDRVFSAVDGKDITPKVPADMTIDRVAVYNGGFAYHFQQGQSEGVVFYDTAGKEIARQVVGFASPMDNSALPIFVVNALSKPEWLVFTGGGKLLLRIPSNSVATDFQTIGTKLYVKKGLVGPDESWQQWDLLTGNTGPTCKMHLGVDYVASDSNVIVTRDTGKNVAFDASTCQTLWETPTEPEDDRVAMWKVNGGLLERTRRSDSIMSLRPAG